VEAARNLNPEDPVKRRFALPLAIVLSGEFVLLVCLNHKVAAAPAPSLPPTIFPALVNNPEDEPTPSEETGGAPAKPQPVLPSPLDPRPDREDTRITIELSPNPIAPPLNPIILPGVPAPQTPGRGNGPGPIGVDQLDNVPQAHVRQPPSYPYQAKVDGLSGEVVVEFIVDYNGRVMNPHVVSSTNPVFEESTLRAISQWRFEPGRRNGTIVRFRMRMPVEFHLDSN
jgi:protein TonB